MTSNIRAKIYDCQILEKFIFPLNDVMLLLCWLRLQWRVAVVSEREASGQQSLVASSRPLANTHSENTPKPTRGSLRQTSRRSRLDNLLSSQDKATWYDDPFVKICTFIFLFHCMGS